MSQENLPKSSKASVDQQEGLPKKIKETYHSVIPLLINKIEELSDKVMQAEDDSLRKYYDMFVKQFNEQLDRLKNL